MPKSKRILHALVLWSRNADDKKNCETQKYEIMELSSIPRKFRKEGATPMLKWTNERSKKRGSTSRRSATVIRISDNIEELQRISPGITGCDSESSEKAPSRDVVRMRKKKSQRASIARSRIVNGSTDNGHGDYNSNNDDEEIPLTEDHDEPSSIENNDEAAQTRLANAVKELASRATEENIRFLESLVDVMKEALKVKKPDEDETNAPYKIPDFYTTPGREKVPLWEGMNFYFYKGVKASIETKSHVTDKSTGKLVRYWPLLVRLALDEIYGKKLADHSAKGSKSGSRPAIDHRLFQAIHYWASDWIGHEVDIDAYVEHINKTCYNKRKGTPQEIKKRMKKTAVPTPQLEDTSSFSENLISTLASSSSPSSSPIPEFPTLQSIDIQTSLQSTVGIIDELNSCAEPNDFESCPWDTADCNFLDLSEGREKVRVAFLGPAPSPATPGVLLLEPLLPNSGHLTVDGMSASPAELLTTHTEHTSPAYHAQISTDSGWDNPFRPDGDLSREADEIVELIKGGKPITPTPGQNAPALPGCGATGGKVNETDDLDSCNRPLLTATTNRQDNEDPGRRNQGNGNAHGTPGKGGNVNSSKKQQQPVNEKVGQTTNTATVEVGRVTAQGPGDASQVEHVTLKKKPKCKCCVLQ